MKLTTLNTSIQSMFHSTMNTIKKYPKTSLAVGSLIIFGASYIFKPSYTIYNQHSRDLSLKNRIKTLNSILDNLTQTLMPSEIKDDSCCVKTMQDTRKIVRETLGLNSLIEKYGLLESLQKLAEKQCAC